MEPNNWPSERKRERVRGRMWCLSEQHIINPGDQMIGCCTLHTDPGLVGDRLQRLDLRGQIQLSDRFSWKPGLIFPQWQAGCDWVSSACARQFLAQKSAWDSNFKTLHRNLRRLWTMTIFTWVVNNWQITWHVCLSSFFVLWKKISRIFLWHSEISNHLNSFAITA